MMVIPWTRSGPIPIYAEVSNERSQIFECTYKTPLPEDILAVMDDHQGIDLIYGRSTERVLDISGDAILDLRTELQHVRAAQSSNHCCYTYGVASQRID